MDAVGQVVMVAFNGCQALDVVGPLEVFYGAGGRYQLSIATPDGIPVISSSGVKLNADLDLLRIRRPIDTLVVAGGRGTSSVINDSRSMRAILRLASRSRRVTSVCTGAFVLASAGVLDGHRATTHWAFCERLAARFPRVSVEPDSIFVNDGKVWTSAGVTAGMDLALALVEADCGRDTSLQIARELVLFVRRPGGQSQFSAQLANQIASRDKLRDLQTWIIDNVGDDLKVQHLAARVGMSGRNFARVFRDQVGIPPAQFVERARIDAARRLLETTTQSLQGIATVVGFATADVFRRAFIRQLNVTPSAYRTRFSNPIL